MKVLEAGNKGLNWTMKHRCTGWGNGHSGCEALLEIEKFDLRYFPGVPGDSWGSRDPAVTFKCPCCSALTDLGLNDWPNDYKNLQMYHSSSAWIEETTVDNVAKVA